MKRNLSSQAIKAMAIGMAVALGSSTAISGVIGGTVVEAYAQGEDKHNTNVSANVAASDKNVVITLEAVGDAKFSGAVSNLTGFTFTGITGSPSTGTVNVADKSVTITIGITEFTGKVSETPVTLAYAGTGALQIDIDGDDDGSSAEDLKINGITLDFSNIDTIAPTVKGVKNYNSTDSTIIIEMKEPLAALGEQTNSSNFTIAKKGNSGTSPVTVDKFVVGNSTNSSTDLKLTLSAPAAGTALDDGIYDINYITELATITDEAGNKLATESPITTLTINENQKKIDKAELSADKTIITLTSNALTFTDSSADAGEFEISGNSVDKSQTVEDIEVNNNTIKLTLSEAVKDATDLKLSYDPASAAAAVTVNSKALFLTDLKINEGAPEKPEIVNELTATVENVGTYTFKRVNTTGESTDVMLTGFTKNANQKAAAPAGNATTGQLKNGVVTANGVEYNLTQIGDGTTPLTEITTEALNGHTNTVTKINASAFEGNTNITNTDIFGNVTTVEANAFKGATKLKNVSLRSATSVGASAFEGASNLTAVNLPKVTSVSSRAFAHTSVKTADLGSEVPKGQQTTVNSNAFAGVKTLERVETNPQSKDSVKEAVKQSDSDNVKVDNGNDTDTVNPGDKNNSSGGGGVGSSGGGASIGTSAPNNNNNNNNINNGGTTTPIVEDKELTFDVISLPSVTGEAKAFGDVSANHWAKAHIDKLSTAGIINGVDGNFNPNGQTKRADVTIMLVNLLGLTPETNTKFADVNPNAYYAPYVGTASTYGIVNGSNGMFNPEGVISRQDTMVMIAQILKGLNLNVNTDTTALTQFTDVNSVAGYANESVAILVNSGIITGNNGKLNPTAPVTRAEMATIMSKLYDVLDATSK